MSSFRSRIADENGYRSYRVGTVISAPTSLWGAPGPEPVSSLKKSASGPWPQTLSSNRANINNAWGNSHHLIEASIPTVPITMGTTHALCYLYHTCLKFQCVLFLAQMTEPVDFSNSNTVCAMPNSLITAKKNYREIILWDAAGNKLNIA